MSTVTGGEDSGQVLRRITRAQQQEGTETQRVTAPGARPTAWVIKIVGLDCYNIYNVQVVQLGSAGVWPAGVGAQMQAVNVAEPFDESGQLPAGTYAIMFRSGDRNVFYVQV